jgi:hypothetical protein
MPLQFNQVIFTTNKHKEQTKVHYFAAGVIE